MLKRYVPHLAIATVLAAGAAAHAVTPSFQGLGSLPGGSVESRAYGISADGATVIGWSQEMAFRWTAAEGMVAIGKLPGDDFSIAEAVSADGSVIVGLSADVSGFHHPFRWTASTGMVNLGYLAGGYPSCRPMGVSDDGSVVVGKASSTPGVQAFRWTLTDPLTGAGNMVGLGDLPGGGFVSHARGVSPDGSIVVGGSWSSVADRGESFLWTEATGMIGLGDLPGDTGDNTGSARAISADGLTVVGSSASASGYEAYRWTEATGMVALGDLPGGGFNSAGVDVSADGSIIVGAGKTNLGYTAAIWIDATAVRSLEDVLVDDYGLDLTGWHLKTAYGISANGYVIAGEGTNPSGDTEAWMATIPEPATLGLLALGACLPLLRRRK